MEVRVIEVRPEQLGAPWAAAQGDDGRRVLFVRADATEAEVAAGYGILRRSERVAS